jgi:hypothetical protein
MLVSLANVPYVDLSYHLCTQLGIYILVTNSKACGSFFIVHEFYSFVQYVWDKDIT